MRHLRSGLAALAAALLLAACSLVQLGYGQIDRIVYWYVDDYLPLDAEQGAALKPRIARLVQWHCSTQMPAYATWLRAVHADLLEAADARQLDRRADEVIGFLRDVAAAAAPDGAALLAQASPQQIEALFAALQKRDRDYRREWADPPPQEILRKREKRMRKRMEAWIGALNPRQEEALQSWSRKLEPTGQSFFDSRLSWQSALRRALARRGEGAAFEAQVRELFARPETYWSPDYLRRVKANRAHTLELLAASAAALDENQRARLESEVRSMAGELDKAACAAPPAKLGFLPPAALPRLAAIR